MPGPVVRFFNKSRIPFDRTVPESTIDYLCCCVMSPVWQDKYVQLISSQCRSRGNLGAKIFEGMFAAMTSYASNAAAVVCSLNHAPCEGVVTRYLAAFVNDMTRASGLVQEVIDGNQTHLEVRAVIDGNPKRVAASRRSAYKRPLIETCKTYKHIESIHINIQNHI